MLTQPSSHRRMFDPKIRKILADPVRSSVNMSYFTKTDLSTRCPWKGDASYYSINLDSKTPFNALELIDIDETRNRVEECGLVLPRAVGEGQEYQELCSFL